ncbi:MAG: M14 family metallopeptidase [Candidatus Aminicenantes bacterium]|nr:M14 family metallopeptidase [Candidatus Aminicenantes bacterium]
MKVIFLKLMTGWRQKFFITSIILIAFAFSSVLSSVSHKIYWGNEVPAGWRGNWPEELLTIPEKTNFERTSSSLEVLEFINKLRWRSDKMTIIPMFMTPQGRAGVAVVLANPRVATPEEAKASGKPVIYLQGNIHPPEAEAKEALLILMREILLGSKKDLLKNQIIIICPNFNPDGNDALRLNEGWPHLIGTRTNSQNLDLNRDAIKIETPEVTGLYRAIFNRWDPVLMYDGHAMSRVSHGYAIGYATSTVPTAHPGPRGYVFEVMFPALRQAVREKFGLEIFTHCLFDEKSWPPKVWSHELAMWTTEAKFIAAAYGLRNRMSILAETPGHVHFERKIYAQYALISAILEYTNEHGLEMQTICRRADEETVLLVKEKASSGELKNFVAGKYDSWGQIDILAYRSNRPFLLPGTSVMAGVEPQALGQPEIVSGVENLTKPVGTKEAKVPLGYLIPAEFSWVAEKLRLHNIKVDSLSKPIIVDGEEFIVDSLEKERRWGYDMTVLKGNFVQIKKRQISPGSFLVSLEQPLANLAFYCLEPEAADGFVGWGLFDSYLKSREGDKKKTVFPIIKYFRLY